MDLRVLGTSTFFWKINLERPTTTKYKVHLHWAKANACANFFLWSLSLLNVNIKLGSLWTHVEARFRFRAKVNESLLKTDHKR